MKASFGATMCTWGLIVESTLLFSSYFVNAFAPRNVLKHGRLGTDSFIAFATVQEDKLTVDEESMLFGSSELSMAKTPMPKKKKSEPSNMLDHSASDPLVSKLRTMRDGLTSCPHIWSEIAKHCPDKRAILDEHLSDEVVDLTFAKMDTMVRRSAAVFQGMGVQKGDKVAVLGENSAQWLLADHGIQMAGGISAVRGADAPTDELRYIYEHSDSAGIVVLQGPRLLKKLAKDAEAKGLNSGLGLTNTSHGPVKTVVLMHREKQTDEDIAKLGASAGVSVHVLSDLLAKTDPMDANDIPQIGMSDLSTIVYTSGTTGHPKGVMLTHGNLLHQIGHRLAPTLPYETADPLPGETMLSLLPVWHITERTCELWMFVRGANVVYSSIRTFKNDLSKFKPQWMVLVPRVLEKVATGVQEKFSSGSAAVQTLAKLFTATSTMKNKHLKISKGLVVGNSKPKKSKKILSRLIVSALAPINAVGDKLVWSKVRGGFGGSIKTIISGGSALAGGLENFYENSGINIIVGYGLTECSPILAFRRVDENLITAGCVGKAAHDTEVRVVDPDSKADDGERKALPTGQVGVVIGRGPQVMKGYYKNPEATAKAVDQYGWFDTGDLGRVNPATGDLILTGRCKDTIVLSNGENIEPSPIEDAILSESSFVDQVMLTGQDGRKLVAIAVLSPKELVNAGFLDAKTGKSLQKENEKVNDPKCDEDDCAAGCAILEDASVKLRSDDSLRKRLVQDMTRATAGFRSWERVQDVYVTLEPFAMANGMLTQSYKVKRASVMERYGDVLPK